MRGTTRGILWKADSEKIQPAPNTPNNSRIRGMVRLSFSSLIGIFDFVLF